MPLTHSAQETNRRSYSTKLWYRVSTYPSLFLEKLLIWSAGMLWDLKLEWFRTEHKVRISSTDPSGLVYVAQTDFWLISDSHYKLLTDISIYYLHLEPLSFYQYRTNCLHSVIFYSLLISLCFTSEIHALNGIRTYNPSFRAGEDSSCFRTRGHRSGLMSCACWIIWIFNPLQIFSWKIWRNENFRGLGVEEKYQNRY
jgi:hypothetical protein